MAQQKALWIPSKQAPFEVGPAPSYKPGPGEILIKVEAAALNPVDWAIQAKGIIVEEDEYPVILGCDAAGTVEDVGEGVRDLKKGDRVLTEMVLKTEGDRAFQQYALGTAELSAKIPDNLSFDQAATLPLALGTSVIPFYHDGENGFGDTLGLTPPWEEGGRGKYKGQPIVIFSGASSVGQCAIQLAKLSGFNPIITTASLRNTDALKALGATHVLDRSLSQDALILAVRAITTEPITVAYDAAGTPETQNAGYELLASGGTLGGIQISAIPPEKTVADKKAFRVYGDFHEPVNRKLSIGFFAHLTALLENGDIKPNRVEVVPGGLQGIPAALQRFPTGLSFLKLVAHPQETA